MISKTVDPEQGYRIVIRPNRSQTWAQTKWFYASICAASLLVAGAMSMLGFWPVLPFAGAELLALGGCIYAVAKAGEVMEVVSVSGDQVAVEKGRREPQQVWTFQRTWARARLRPPKIAWYPSQLVIGCRGTEVELGRFLTEEERRHLADELERALRDA